MLTSLKHTLKHIKINLMMASGNNTSITYENSYSYDIMNVKHNNYITHYYHWSEMYDYTAVKLLDLRTSASLIPFNCDMSHHVNFPGDN